MSTTKPLSGGARLIKSGRSPVLVGLFPDQKDLLLEAAKADGRPLTQFLIFHGIAAAKKILEKTRKSP